MEKLNQIILQMKRQRHHVPPEAEPVKKPAFEEAKRPSPVSQTSQSPVNQSPLVSDEVRTVKKPEIEESSSVFTEDLGVSDSAFYTESEYIPQAKELEIARSQGKQWKRGKYQHPFMVEATLLSLPQKLYVIRRWTHGVITDWEASQDQPDLQQYANTLAESRNLLGALLRSIQQGLLTEESLQLAFVVVRLGQIDRSSSARDFQFKLSVIPSWLDPQAADREELMRPDRQRLYSQLLKRLLSVSQLLRPTSK